MGCNINFLVLAGFLTIASAANQHLICKSVNDIFSENIHDDKGGRNQSTITSQVQGRPGKMGPIGPRGLSGPRGLKGEPGFVDYNNISEIIEKKVCEGLTSIAAVVHGLRAEVNALRLSLNDQLSCIASDFLYNGTCYSLPYISQSVDLNRAQAVEICRNIGAELAEIHDKTHQFAIMESLVRPRIPSPSSTLYLWLGMTYDNQRKTIHYISGRDVAHQNDFLWWSGHPTSHKYMALGVRRSLRDGIFDSSAQTSRHGVICQKSIT